MIRECAREMAPTTLPPLLTVDKIPRSRWNDNRCCPHRNLGTALATLAMMVTYDYHVVMKTVGVAEFKARLSEYLRRVRRGHELTILDRDQPIARVVPYASSAPLSVREPLVSYATLKEVPLPPPLDLGGDIVDLLIEDRRADG